MHHLYSWGPRFLMKSVGGLNEIINVRRLHGDNSPPWFISLHLPWSFNTRLFFFAVRCSAGGFEWYMPGLMRPNHLVETHEQSSGAGWSLNIWNSAWINLTILLTLFFALWPILHKNVSFISVDVERQKKKSLPPYRLEDPRWNAEKMK